MSTRPRKDPLVGHTLVGKYRIHRFIREEELGKVYDAVILPAEKPVSIKVLHPHLVEDVEAFGRFGREMLATATINHPNTIAMIDFGEHREIFHYLVLERFSARTLKDELEKNKRLPWDRVAHIGGQISSALAAAHNEGIFHRNLNSWNILLLNNAVNGDYVKIRDFGLARLHDADGNVDDGGLTAVGTRVGSASYMAPEYIMDGYVGASVDLYGLGILIYEMLTGAPPFVGHAGVVMDMHCDEVPAPLTSKVEDIPDWLDKITMQLLEKEPGNRPRNAAEILGEFQRCMGSRLGPPELKQEDNIVAPTPQMEEKVKDSAATSKIIGLIVVAMAIVMLLVLLIGGLVVLGVFAT